jgi:serine protease AprX
LNPQQKISPAFEPYLASSQQRDSLEAIVIYRSPPIKRPPTRSSRGRATRRRFQAAAQADAHRDIETRIARSYLDKVSGKVEDDVEVETIGSSALPAITVEVTPSTLEELATQPEVLAILPNQRIHLIRPHAIQYDSLAKQEIRSQMTWGLQELQVHDIWHKSQGEGVNVGILDTGVFGEHPLLENRVTEFVMIDPLGRRISASPMFDANGHGTHVAGTIAGGATPDGISVGVAPKAHVHMGAVLVGDTTLRTLLEGIDWCVQKGSDILNLSLGFNYYEPLFSQVFEVLIDQYEMLPVVAIGNENQGNSSSPGNAHNALGVGAVEVMGRSRMEVAFFSSGASLVFPDLSPGTVITKPDIVAPGAQIYSAIPPVLRSDGAYMYAYMDGTSMATPHVAGVAALLMAAQPKAAIRDIMQAIKETALHPAGDDHRPDNRWGYGLIQAEQAMLALA